MIGSLGFILGTTLMYATPLIYASLGGVISERSGVINIGLEGLLAFGAFAGATVGYYTGNPWLGFLAGGVGSGLIGLVHAISSVTFHGDQVVSGIAINFIGPGLAIFLSRKFFSGAAMTIPVAVKIPKFLPGVFPKYSFLDNLLNQNLTTVIAILVAAIMWFILYKTVLGLRILSVGENPEAADTLGISVRKIRYGCVITSGVLAGLGGASMSLAVASNFFPTLISGHGFIALAAMIFGQWKPHGALGACLIFGMAQALVIFMGGTSISISTELLSMLPYLLTLIILLGFVGSANAPAADGQPYEKE